MPPDTREFTVPRDYLNAWCSSQPERSSHDLVADLASYAGCSWTQMRKILSGDRPLALGAVPGLVKGLALPEEQAEHFRRTAELQHAPARTSLPLRKQVWSAFAAATGIPWEGCAALLDEVQSAALTEAALAPALATLEDGLPTPKQLVKCAVVPVVHANVAAVSPAIGAWKQHRVAPRMIHVPDPREGGATLSTWLGLLGWAREALVRLPADQREYRSFTAAVDERAVTELTALCQGVRVSLEALASDAEWLPEERVVAVLVELIPLAGPLLGGGASRVQPWQQAGLEFTPLLTEGEPPPPHPGPSEPGAEPIPPLAGQTHFPTWLKLWRSWRARQGKEHSDGYLARRTGLSRPSIHDLATGLVAFGSHHVPIFLKALGLEEDPSAPRVLEAMARIAAREHPQHQAKLVAAQRAYGLEQGVRCLPTEAHFAQSRWYVRATYLAAQLPGFQAVPGWISRLLLGRITWKAAEEALIVLSQLGLLARRADGVVVAVEPKVRVQGPHADLALIELHDGILKLLQSELGFGGTAPHVYGDLLTLPERAMPRLQRIVAGFGAEVRAVLAAAEDRRLSGEPMDRLILVSWQFFQAFRLPLKKKKARS